MIPILVLIAISAGLVGTGLLTARDFDRGTAKIMIVSPCGRLPLVLGRLLLRGTFVTVALLVSLVGVGFLTPHVPVCSSNPGEGGATWILAACAWSLRVPSWSRTATLAALLLALLLTALGCGTLLGVAAEVSG